MKYFLSLSLILIVLTSSYSQLDKNTWLISGAGSFYSYTEDYTSPAESYTFDYTSFDVSATIGYFFFDKFSLGLRPYFSTLIGQTPSGGVSTYGVRFAIGPATRYYFLKKNKEFNLLTDISYLMGINKGSSGNDRTGVFNIFSIMVGTELFLNSSVGVEILLGYKNQLSTYGNSPSDNVNRQGGFQSSVGFQFHLTK